MPARGESLIHNATKEKTATMEVFVAVCPIRSGSPERGDEAAAVVRNRRGTGLNRTRQLNADDVDLVPRTWQIKGFENYIFVTFA
jgi:hypothetical protein